MRKIIREPLIQFLFIGFALFVLANLLSKRVDSADTITISDGQVESLLAKWEMQWKRPPTAVELTRLIEHKISQEIYYLEALKMNLDDNDEIIKRRLAQKMKFLSSDLASLKAISEQDLLSFYQQNPQNYMTEMSYSLYQIVFVADHRDDPKQDAIDMLRLIGDESFEPTNSAANSSTISAVKGKGDNLSLAYYYHDVTTSKLSKQLGNKFVEGLNAVPLNQWSGSVTSGFGEHLVYVTEKVAPSLASFDSVKAAVQQDFEYQRQQDTERTVYQQLKQQYKIEIQSVTQDYGADFMSQLQHKLNQ